ncbi:MAG: DUF4013 domain-containing protein [Candidatus Aenigmarchaeota archaeon]|nr:DUF4013 domain-containing protein [Candidatus Aenigmarchaeota archaeon]
MVNYESAIKKPFSDAAKLIIGIIISVIPIVNWISTGYALETSGLGKNKASNKMPEWKEVGDLFVKGLASSVIGFVYALPAVLVFVAGIGFAATSLIGTYMGSVIPEGTVQSLIAGETTVEAVSQLVSQNWYLALPTLLSLAPILLLGVVLMMVARFVTPIAVLNYLSSKKFSRAFDVSAVLKKSFTMKYFTVWVVATVVTVIVSALLSLVPMIGASIAMFVGSVISYSMFGEVFRELKGRR